ncbi:MAG: hypothetical protein GY913_21530 [Proteobacteria bacterium]|nr:hypothetical protein [Actinomycetes bacterium]MCP4919491.1 hypothetical protein [Pseudomonadota bacterium]
MALTRSNPDGFTTRIADQTAASTTADSDLYGGAAKLYSLDINNAASQANYAKVYDVTEASASDDPVLILKVPNGERHVVTCTQGFQFSTGVTWRAVQEAGTAGTTSPSGGNFGITGVMK